MAIDRIDRNDYLAYAIRQLTYAWEKADDAPASSATHVMQAEHALSICRIPTLAERLDYMDDPNNY